MSHRTEARLERQAALAAEGVHEVNVHGLRAWTSKGLWGLGFRVKELF